jgi:adenosylhomocysteine nucleosidase
MIDPRLAELVERAFDYRGYVTLRRKDGSELVGFVYDRGDAHVDLFDESAAHRLRVPLAEIASIDFTGEDSARKSQEMWERRKGRLEPRETPAHGGWDESRPILLVVALDRELRSVARALGLTRHRDRARGRLGGSDLIALAVGMGGGVRNGVAAAEPRMVVSCGFSGGLDPGLRSGDLVLATAVRDENGDRLAAPEPLRGVAAAALQGLRCVQGEIVCTTAVAATPEEKRALAHPGTAAVDMESFTAARAASEAGIPWLALRAVVDPLDAALPPFTRDPHRSPLGAALRYAASGPRAFRDLVRLARDARRAAAALEEALHRLGPALAAAEARA